MVAVVVVVLEDLVVAVRASDVALAEAMQYHSYRNLNKKLMLFRSAKLKTSPQMPE